MGGKVVGLLRPAKPSIEQVLGEFLVEQSRRLKPRTLSKYKNVIDLLQHHLNGYAYEGLSKAESALFEKYYNAEGREHREFCQLFGPAKIVEELGSFLGYFMIRKVMAGEDTKRAAGTVTKKLSAWLSAKGYISAEVAQDGVDAGADAARKLPKAERAAQILVEAAVELGTDPNDLADEDYLDFDHFTIAKLESGKLWLETFDSRETALGPILVPKKATNLLQEGWDISCALGRVRGTWRIVEIANVYPL